MKVKFITNIDKVEQLSAEEKEKIKPITEMFDFRINDYYLNLIDWDDPDDPIKKLSS